MTTKSSLRGRHPHSLDNLRKKPSKVDGRCVYCGLSDFNAEGRCKVCRNRAARDWRRNNPVLTQEYKRKYLANGGRATQNRCCRDWHRALKRRIVEAYGGACACCGVTEIEFLTIDHSLNDGAAHRRQIGQTKIYRWLEKHGFPQVGFRLLCWNCNAARQFWGACPHERARAAVA